MAEASLLSLAATPSFAVLALFTANDTDILCGHASSLGGMSLMYGLMVVFHLPPWLRLLKRPG